jgi:hypothetical protein
MRNVIDCSAIEHMTDLDLIAFMGTIYGGMSASSVIQEAKWHGDSPRLDGLKENRDILQAAYDAAIYKDIQKIAAKKEARTRSIDIIKKIASNVELSIWDDPAKIAALGFPLRRPRTSITSALGVTESYNLVHGEHPGQVIGKAKRIPGATFYDVRITDGNPTVQEGYRHFDSFSACSNMEYNGLTPTKQYSFCVRGRSSKSTGPWSSPVTIIAI